MYSGKDTHVVNIQGNPCFYAAKAYVIYFKSKPTRFNICDPKAWFQWYYDSSILRLQPICVVSDSKHIEHNTACFYICVFSIEHNTTCFYLCVFSIEHNTTCFYLCVFSIEHNTTCFYLCVFSIEHSILMTNIEMLHAWVIGYAWHTIAPFHYEFLNGVGVKQKLYIDCHIEIVWFVTKTCVDIISCSIIFYIVSFFYFQLNVDDQILLLKSCCMEVMCLRAACRFDPEAETLFLHNGMKLHKSQIHQGGVAVLIEPIFDFAMGLSKLKLDKAEIALLAAILLMQSG